jgi:hypothetical protein
MAKRGIKVQTPSTRAIQIPEGRPVTQALVKHIADKVQRDGVHDEHLRESPTALGHRQGTACCPWGRTVTP